MKSAWNGIVWFSLVCLLSLPLGAQVPQLINYQGRIAVSGTNFTGTGQFQFALVNSGAAATYWSNGVGNVSVAVSKGLYSVLLGDTTLTNMAVLPATVFTNSDVRLRVKFNDGVHGLQLLTPDQRLAAAGYALVAQTANSFPATRDLTAARLNIGVNNTLSGQNATVAGGYDNTASGSFAAIGGGSDNIASGTTATVAGGYFNAAGGYAAVVAGGEGNHASGLDATVGGGRFNQASGTNASVVGGYLNIASGAGAFVGGGGFDGTSYGSNVASGAASVIGGGNLNLASGMYATVGGGGANIASSDNSTVSGGGGNIAKSDSATVGGGVRNTAGAVYATVGGGYFNAATGVGSVIGGGGYDGATFGSNVASGAASVIGGGTLNTASNEFTTVGGGHLNAASASHATVGGGFMNTANGWNATVAGGIYNSASNFATVCGGIQNTANGLYATVAGGQYNIAEGNCSFAAGNYAKATNEGAFVWADSTSMGFYSTTSNQFLVRASGGVGIGTNDTSSATLTVAGSVKATSFIGDGSGLTNVARPAGAVYRWNVFHGYDDNYNWLMGNDTNMFGGVAPSDWFDNYAKASQMSSDKEMLRTVYTRKGYGGKNATVVAMVESSYSSTDGEIATVLFRIKNNLAVTNYWTNSFYYTCNYTWGETASVAVNGSNIWDSGTATGPFHTSVIVPIPPSRTSTVIFVSAMTGAPSVARRGLVLAFNNNCLALPTGLEYIDDLDTASGGWEQ